MLPLAQRRFMEILPEMAERVSSYHHCSEMMVSFSGQDGSCFLWSMQYPITRDALDQRWTLEKVTSGREVLRRSDVAPDTVFAKAQRAHLCHPHSKVLIVDSWHDHDNVYQAEFMCEACRRFMRVPITHEEFDHMDNSQVWPYENER
jgi:hypothetical protein